MAKNRIVEVPQPSERQVFLTGPLNEQKAADILQAIYNIRNEDRELSHIYETIGAEYKPQPIQLIINSMGGGVYPMMTIISVMEAAGETPVNTYAFGYAFSAAALIFLKGYRRHISQRTTLMFHELSTMMEGELHDLTLDLNEATRLQKMMNTMIVANSTIPAHILRQKIQKGNWWIDAKTAMKYNMADLILTTDKMLEAKKQKAKATDNK